MTRKTEKSFELIKVQMRELSAKKREKSLFTRFELACEGRYDLERAKGYIGIQTTKITFVMMGKPEQQ